MQVNSIRCNNNKNVASCLFIVQLKGSKYNEYKYDLYNPPRMRLIQFNAKCTRNTTLLNCSIDLNTFSFLILQRESAQQAITTSTLQVAK